MRTQQSIVSVNVLAAAVDVATDSKQNRARKSGSSDTHTYAGSGQYAIMTSTHYICMKTRHSNSFLYVMQSRGANRTCKCRQVNLTLYVQLQLRLRAR
jgi:hypothetical protein